MIELHKQWDTTRTPELDFPGNFTILSPGDFYLDFASRSTGAKRIVGAQTMYFESGHVLDSVVKTLLSARQRGVPAALNVDAYSLMIYKQSMAIPIFGITPEGILEKMEILDWLKDQGVAVTVTRPPSLVNTFFPFKGRNHAKLAIADNVAWVGGLSFRDADLPKEDFMMRFTDPRIVGVLEDYLRETNEGEGITQDMIIPCTDTTSVMIDSGKPGESLTYRMALSLIENAERSVKLATQFVPGGEMANTLYECYRRGLDVKVFVSRNDLIDEWFGRGLDFVTRQVNRIRGRIPGLYYESDPRIHAKALCVDGEQDCGGVAIIGSHNFIPSGVTLGTEELSIISRSGPFVRNVEDYLKGIERRITDNPLTSKY